MKYLTNASEDQRSASYIEVVGQWLLHQDGTGDRPHIWETVFSAFQEMGFTLLVKEVTQKLSKRLETSQQYRLSYSVSV